MANFNKVILVGNLTRDPALRYLANNTPIADFGMAVSHKYKTAGGEAREETLFIDCTVFGKGAEIINQYCQKGKQLMVEGRLKYESWEDKQGGGKRSKHVVNVDNFQLMGDRGGSGGNVDRSTDQTQPPPARRPAPPRGQRPPAQSPASEERHFEEADIPF